MGTVSPATCTDGLNVTGAAAAVLVMRRSGGRSLRHAVWMREAIAGGLVECGGFTVAPDQDPEITRETRPVSARTGRNGRWSTETVYAITDLGQHQARPEELAIMQRN